MIYVKVSAFVYPTEDSEKVRKAIISLFTNLKIEKEPVKITGNHKEISPLFLLSGEDGIELLQSFHGLIRREGIIDSIRDKVFNKGLSNDGLSTRFLLNKQAAFVGIPSIPPQEEPLGSIEVFIKAGSQAEMERLFTWLLPPTENGKSVIEVEMKSVEVP